MIIANSSDRDGLPTANIGGNAGSSVILEGLDRPITGRGVFAIRTLDSAISVETAFLEENGNIHRLPAVFPNREYAMEQLDELRLIVDRHFDDIDFSKRTGELDQSEILNLQSDAAPSEGNNENRQSAHQHVDEGNDLSMQIGELDQSEILNLQSDAAPNEGNDENSQSVHQRVDESMFSLIKFS